MFLIDLLKQCTRFMYRPFIFDMQHYFSAWSNKYRMNAVNTVGVGYAFNL